METGWLGPGTLSFQHWPLCARRRRSAIFQKSRAARNANHPATAAGGVGPPPRPPHMDIRPPAPPPAAALPATLFGDQSAEDKYRPRATSSTTRSSRRASRRMSTRSCSASRPRATSSTAASASRSLRSSPPETRCTDRRPPHRLGVLGRGGHRRRRHACGEDLASRRIDF